MNCPNCQTLCGDADRFCYLCGTPLQELPPKPKKGARWVPILLLVLMAAVGLTAFFATAGNNAPIHAEGSAPWFYVRDGVLYFEEHKYTGSSELTVPGEIAGQTVRSLSDDCFADCDTLTAVNLPDSLTAIGKGAFRDCMALRGMDIPDSVSTIGKEAFSGCSALEAVHIPASVHTIGADAFRDCGYLGYIFYDGPHRIWETLYPGFISPYTGVFCTDGSFYQGGEPYQ